MSCCHHYLLVEEGKESVFTVDFNPIKFGLGALKELPDDLRSLNVERVGLFTDSTVKHLEPVLDVVSDLQTCGISFEVYDEVSVEPTDKSFRKATQFAIEGNFDGFVSIGGGSVIDTCKAANLYSTYPAEFLDYVNAPVGAGKPVPGELKPHIACPTTSGTGSECTGIAVFDFLELQVKTGIASPRLKPQRAIIDPSTTGSLPANVVASSGFDVLSHALESYTARPFTLREKPDSPAKRPLSQGANPYSDIGCREALRLTGEYLVRATLDAEDTEARQSMMLAATLAGVAFGNSGVHLPHAMSYSIAGLVRDYCPDGYPAGHSLVPHGISVIVGAPAAFRFTCTGNPDRHIEGAELLGGDVRDAGMNEAGYVLAETIQDMMKATRMPNGISEVGYGQGDIKNLVEGAYMQKRLVDNAPCTVTADALENIYTEAIQYW